METIFLNKFRGKKLSGQSLHFREIKKLRSGWQEFKLFLGKKLVVEGIYSKGGKGVKPWLDIVYNELADKKAARKLFKYLGDVIPPGGHIMVSYEGGQKLHKDTLKALNTGVPPAATPLGFLIFQAGFQYVKDWYLAEGGYEGPRKLWGEKAPDKSQENVLLKRTAEELQKFSAKKYHHVLNYSG